MTIALLSTISTGSLAEYLDEESRAIALSLSNNVAPAVTTLALEWLKAGHKLVVFTLDLEAHRRMVLHGENLTIYVAPDRLRLKIARLFAPLGRDTMVLLKMVRSHKGHIDVVSAHWTRDFALAALHFRHRCPIFVTVRDIMPYIIRQIHGIRNYAWYLIWIKNEIVMRRREFRFIANSAYTAASVRKFWGKESVIIPNAINDKYLVDDYKPNRGDNGGFTMATISMSLLDDRRKNIPTLLQALKIVRATYPDTTLSLIAPNIVPDSPTVKRYADAGLMEGVKFVGALPHDEVVDYLRTVDLMVHPSLEETFGNTLIEAMAAGCPTLGGNDSGAVPYVLDFGRMGYLCDVTSAEDIAETIIEIIRHPEQRAKMAADARRYCSTIFSSHLLAEKYITLFSNTIATFKQ